jgi:hypothetical protein
MFILCRARPVVRPARKSCATQLNAVLDFSAHGNSKCRFELPSLSTA